MTINRDVKDFAIRDDWPAPRELMHDVFARHREAIERLIERSGVTRTSACGVCIRASEPRAVINAPPDGECLNCHQILWVAPSIRRGHEDSLFVCEECLAAEMGEPSVRAMHETLWKNLHHIT